MSIRGSKFPPKVLPASSIITLHRSLTTNFHVDQDGLAASINRLLETPTGELAATGALARQWFDDNDRAFRQRFHQLTAELLSAS